MPTLQGFDVSSGARLEAFGPGPVRLARLPFSHERNRNKDSSPIADHARR
jgi:hypothetical protein